MTALSVAHVLLSFGVGGQERVVLDLASAQLRLGHDITAVELASGPEGALGVEFRKSGARVCRVAQRDGFDPTLYPRLVSLFRKLRVQLVHTHNPGPLIYAAPAGKLARARVVHTKHGEHRDTARRWLLRRTAARFADAFVAVSETTADFARRHRECAARKLRVIRNGTDLSRFGRDASARERVRAELGIAADAWVVGSVGRFVPEKNQDLLVRAAGALLSQGVHLVLAGGGALEADIRRVAGEQSHPERIHVLGLRSDVPELLAAFDAFAMSSRTEGLPIALIEAMSSELPVVSTAVGGIPSVIADGDTGLLVEPGDAGALTDALSRLRADPPLAQRLASRARALALSELSADRMHTDYMSLYETVLRERGPWKTRFARS